MSDSNEAPVSDVKVVDTVDTNDSIFMEDAFNEDLPSDEEISAALEGFEGLDEESDNDNASPVDSNDDEPIKSVEEEKAPETDIKADESDEKSEIEEKPDVTDNYEVKINGETTNVSLQELKNNYSGEKEVAKRFTELDKEKKEFYTEKTEVENYVNNFASKMQDGDVVGAFGYFASFANIPPHMVKEQLVAALRPEIERRNQLTAEQLEGESLKAQNEHLKSLNESETKRRDTEQSNNDLQSQINSVREAHSITDDEWEAAFSTLDKEVSKDEIITVDQVKDRVITVKADNTASNVLAEFEGLPETAKTSLVDVILQNPDFTESTLKEIVKESIEAARKSSSEEDLKNKLSKSSSKKAVSGQEEGTDAKVTIAGVEIEPLESWD